MRHFSGVRVLQGASFILLGGFCLSVAADVKKNPYESIADRNPFALKPPPPPATNEVAVAPPPPPPIATVELKGIVSILGKSKRALFEVIPGPGKQMAKPILAEGEKFESVEVVAINIEKNEVTVKNGTLVTNLTFTVAKSGPVVAAANPAGLPNPLMQPAIHQSAPPVQQSAYNNTGRNNVMVGGGAPTTPAAAPNALANPNANAGFNSPVVSPNDPNFRSIPSRNIRTTAPQANAPVSLEEHYIMTEMNRNVHGLPLPPTPLNPNPVYAPRGNNQGGNGNLPPGVNFPPLPGGGNPQQ